MRLLAALPLALTTGAVAAAQTGTAPVPGADIASLAWPLVRMLASLGAVLALVAGLAWVARRLRAAGGVRSGLIEIVSGVSLGASEKVVLLRVGSEQVLVGVSPAGMRALHVMKDKTPSFPECMETKP
jgi:flagellar protein FliO/FliZ